LVTKEQVAELMLKAFPKCPICGSDSGYEVSGIFKDYVRCITCKTKWQSDDFKRGEELSKLKLHETGIDRIGAYLLHVHLSIDFWKNFKPDADIYWDVLPKPKPEISKVLVLEKKEGILTSWSGDREIATTVMEKGTSKAKKVKQYGSLVLTNRRLFWVISRGFFGKSYHPIFEIQLEDIKGVSSGGAVAKYISISDTQGEHVFHLATDLERFNPLMQSSIKARKKQIEAEKKKERVHIMLDFSFLKDYMKKGGLALQTFKCPECGAPMKLPESGDHATCKHCGNTVYAQDIFEKVKTLIG